jgi:GST-like protein
MESPDTVSMELYTFVRKLQDNLPLCSGMEVQRLCSVLDQHLAKNAYLAGEEYSIADMVVFPWFNQLQTGYKHPCGVSAADFLSIDQYAHAVAWAEKIKARPAVQRGLQVCHMNGQGKPWLAEKSDA